MLMQLKIRYDHILVGFATTFAFSCLPTAFALQARETHRVVVYFLAKFDEVFFQ